MYDEYWQKKWESNEIGFHQANPNPLLNRYFETLDLQPGSRVFVPLCGKSMDMLWLAQQGYQVVGVELSTIACRAFFEEHAIPFTVTQLEHFTLYHSAKITLLEGDLFHVSKDLLGQIDAVFDRAALVALPQATRRRYADFLMDLLPPNLRMLLVAFTYDQQAMQGPPFSVDSHEVAELYGAKFHIEVLFNEAVPKISPHLQAKGLTWASEQAYCLRPKDRSF